MTCIPKTLKRNQIGSAAVEFALVAPTFLMFIFLILDGGRMLFLKQSLNDVATATARCFAIKAVGCTDVAAAQNWAVARAINRDNFTISTNTTMIYPVTISTVGVCNGLAQMVQVTVTVPWKKGAMTFLPQSIAPPSLTSIACFPMAS